MWSLTMHIRSYTVLANSNISHCTGGINSTQPKITVHFSLHKQLWCNFRLAHSHMRIIHPHHMQTCLIAQGVQMPHVESVILPSNSTFDTSRYAYFTHTSDANLSFRTGGVNAARRKRRPPLQEYIRHLNMSMLHPHITHKLVFSHRG